MCPTREPTVARPARATGPGHKLFRDLLVTRRPGSRVCPDDGGACRGVRRGTQRDTPRGSDDRCGCSGRLALSHRGQASGLARGLLRRRPLGGRGPRAGGLHPAGPQRTPHPRRGARRGIPAFDRHQPRPGPQPARPRLAPAPPTCPSGRTLGGGTGHPPGGPPRGHPRAALPADQAARLRGAEVLPLDLSIPDIAASLGLSANSVKTHLQRGLRAMGQKLGGTR